MEIAVFGDERRNFFEGSNRSSTYEDQVAADSQARIEFGEFDGVIEGRATGHQSGAGEDSFAMGTDNAFIYSAGEAEVVGIEDELLHLRAGCLRGKEMISREAGEKLWRTLDAIDTWRSCCGIAVNNGAWME